MIESSHGGIIGPSPNRVSKNAVLISSTSGPVGNRFDAEESPMAFFILGGKRVQICVVGGKAAGEILHYDVVVTVSYEQDNELGIHAE
jgi:hypothetical protein